MAAKEPMVTMLVANGRTLTLSNGFDLVDVKKVVSGKETVEKVKVPNTDRRIAHPGEEVSLPKPDAERLHALGFLRLRDEADTRPLHRPMMTESGPVTVTSQDA